MPFEFVKFHGTGNDFILVDDRALRFSANDQKLVQLVCDRHFGIGADGLILIRHFRDNAQAHSAKETRLEFSMVYFNADGFEGSFCGNGGRCAVRFARELGLCGERTVFEAADGLHEAEILPDGRISLAMKPLTAWNRDGAAWLLDTGSPHCVFFTDETPDLDVVNRGRPVRYAESYAPGGVNVNFAGPGSGAEEDPVFMRTYERGVEDETLSCGTGAVAVALALALEHNLQGPQGVALRSPGGHLEVRFSRTEDQFDHIRLIGPAQAVFRGTWTGGHD